MQSKIFSLNQAVDASPVLSQMAQRVRLSQHLLERVRPLMPPGLRGQVLAGPVDDESWCLLVSNPAVATKLKQLVPALLAALRNDGQTVQRLRIKVRGR